MSTAEQHIVLTLEQQGEAAYRDGLRMGREHQKALDEGREPAPEVRPIFRLTTEHAASSRGVPVVVDLDGNAYGADDRLEVALPSVADAAGTSHKACELWSFGGLIALAAELAAEEDAHSPFIAECHKFLGWDPPMG